MTRLPDVLKVLFLLAALAPAGCRRSAAGTATPRQTLEDFTLRQTLRGTTVWKLVTRCADLDEQSQLAQLTEPAMEFYKNGKVASRVVARGGQVHVVNHDVLLSGSVVLDAPEEGSTLSTDSLAYSSKRGLFTTESEVSVRRPEGQLRGRGLEAKPDLSEIRIFNQRSMVKGNGA